MKVAQNACVCSRFAVKPILQDVAGCISCSADIRLGSTSTQRALAYMLALTVLQALKAISPVKYP